MGEHKASLTDDERDLLSAYRSGDRATLLAVVFGHERAYADVLYRSENRLTAMCKCGWQGEGDQYSEPFEDHVRAALLAALGMEQVGWHTPAAVPCEHQGGGPNGTCAACEWAIEDVPVWAARVSEETP